LAYWGPYSVQIFDIATGKQRAGAGSSAAVAALRFAPDGSKLIVSNFDFEVKSWDPRSAKLQRSLPRFENEGAQRALRLEFFVDQIAFSSDGKLVAVTSGESGVGVWNVQTGAAVKWYGPEAEKNDRPNFESAPKAFAFAPRDHILATS